MHGNYIFSLTIHIHIIVLSIKDKICFLQYINYSLNKICILITNNTRINFHSLSLQGRRRALYSSRIFLRTHTAVSVSVSSMRPKRHEFGSPTAIIK